MFYIHPMVDIFKFVMNWRLLSNPMKWLIPIFIYTLRLWEIICITWKRHDVHHIFMIIFCHWCDAIKRVKYSPCAIINVARWSCDEFGNLIISHLIFAKPDILIGKSISTNERNFSEILSLVSVCAVKQLRCMNSREHITTNLDFIYLDSIFVIAKTTRIVGQWNIIIGTLR